MVLTKEEKNAFRKLLFKHQDGLAITASIAAFFNNGIFKFIEDKKQTTLDEILAFFTDFYKGYLNVSLRSLASQGILNYQVFDNEIRVVTTPKYKNFKKYIKLYHEFDALYKIQLQLLKTPLDTFSISEDHIEFSYRLNRLKTDYKLDNYFVEEVYLHLEGVLLIPVLVYLNYQSHLENYPVKEVVSKNNKLILFFENLDLLEKGDFTKKGQFLFDKSYAYGVTTSYLPIMTHIETYLKGDFTPFFERDMLGNEKHVFRGINVWGSGGSHTTYFKKIDTILTTIFNKPIHEQPKGIIDVGCGNGAFLEHIFNLIWNDTNRRKDMDANKLILIGADYNKESLLSTQRNLKRADVWAEVVWGDIGNPAELDLKLQDLYNVKLADLLNIRSFLDHNRPFNEPTQAVKSKQVSSGAFAHRGKWINNHDAEQSLVEHFKKWKPYIKKQGLLLIELHTIAPETVSLNIGNTPCTAYDVTHGFSDQYIVEVEIFNNAIEKAGLKIDKNHFYKFPNSELSTVSINLIS